MAESEQRPRVLIVEDHPIIAELVETRLRIEGMDPIKCPGGREALEIIGTQPLDAVILDIMMPDVDGYEVLRHIRSQPATRRLPVIFLTARSTPADIEKGLAMGANYYITKPFSGLDLVRKVRICIEERRVAAELVATRGRADWSGVGGREVPLQGDGKTWTVRVTFYGSVEGQFLLDTG